MRLPAVAFSTLACVGLVLGAALLFRLPLEQAAVLAPVLVASVGALGFIVVLWTRVAATSLRQARHPRRIVATGVGFLALLVVLSFIVELPAGH